MAEITAAQVRELRDKTGLPMMECKAALSEVGGDETAAVAWLQKKYKGKMEERASRETAEGRIGLFISPDKTLGAIVDLRCETAPVAKTEVFIGLLDQITRAVAAQAEAAPAADNVLTLKLSDGRNVSDAMTEVYGKLRETMKLALCRRMTGKHIAGYVHHDGKSAVLVALNAPPSDESVATDLCHHVVFSKPMAIDRSGLPAEEIERVRTLAREVAEGEGKKPEIVEKIVEGKVNAFCAEKALMEQEHVKVSKTSVGDVLKQAGVTGVTDLAIQIIGA